jgi:hypothetical protein
MPCYGGRDGVGRASTRPARGSGAPRRCVMHENAPDRRAGRWQARRP